MDGFWEALGFLLGGGVIGITLMSALFVAAESSNDEEIRRRDVADERLV